MNRSLFYIVVVAALGGFLFGFDEVIVVHLVKAVRVLVNQILRRPSVITANKFLPGDPLVVRKR